MSLLKFLGIDGLGKQARERGDTASVRRIAAQLERLEPADAKLLASFAYVLARVASADLTISEEETAEMERIVRSLAALSEGEAALVVQIAKTQSHVLGDTENYVVTREFRRIASREQRVASPAMPVRGRRRGRQHLGGRDLDDPLDRRGARLHPRRGERPARGVPRQALVRAARHSRRLRLRSPAAARAGALASAPDEQEGAGSRETCSAVGSGLSWSLSARRPTTPSPGSSASTTLISSPELAQRRGQAGHALLGDRRGDPDLRRQLGGERLDLRQLVLGEVWQSRPSRITSEGLAPASISNFTASRSLEARQRVGRVGADAAVAVDLGVQRAAVLQVRRSRQLLEDRVVVGAHVGHRMVEGDVQDAARAQQLVEGDADQEGGLADAVAGQHDAQVPDPEAAVQALLEQAQRAPRVQKLLVQPGHPLELGYSSSSLILEPYFSLSCFCTSEGAGR